MCHHKQELIPIKYISSIKKTASTLLTTSPGDNGLIGLIVGCVLVVRLWRSLTPAGRIESFPFVLSMALMLFPLNSHFALYGTYMSSLIWILFGLWAGCIEHHAPHTDRDG